MYRVEFYAEVRRSVYVEGLSERAAARRFGLARETVRKMLRYRHKGTVVHPSRHNTVNRIAPRGNGPDAPRSRPQGHFARP